MVESIIQVYQDMGGKTLFAQVMKVDMLKDRRKQSDELGFDLDSIMKGTEVIYESNIRWRELNKQFFVEVVRKHENWRKDESFELMGKRRLYGISYPFFPECYEQLNQEIRNKLSLKPKN